jgi:hypothetical protein
MHDSPAFPVVRGVMVIHDTLLDAVHVPVPLVRMDPPPPSRVKVREGGSILIDCARNDSRENTRVPRRTRKDFMIGNEAACFAGAGG